MAKRRADENGAGANHRAVEALAAEIEEKYGVVSVADRPLIERAKSLSSAVDNDPTNSQLQIQFGAALIQLRSEVLSAHKAGFDSMMWSLKTGCDIHDRDEVHCATCCTESPSISDVKNWDPPWRASLADDEEFGRSCVIVYLRTRHQVKYE